MGAIANTDRQTANVRSSARFSVRSSWRHLSPWLSSLLPWHLGHPIQRTRRWPVAAKVPSLLNDTFNGAALCWGIKSNTEFSRRRVSSPPFNRRPLGR